MGHALLMPALKGPQSKKTEGSGVFEGSCGAELPHQPALADLLHDGERNIYFSSVPVL